MLVTKGDKGEEYKRSKHNAIQRFNEVLAPVWQLCTFHHLRGGLGERKLRGAQSGHKEACERRPK